eukprot:403361939
MGQCCSTRERNDLINGIETRNDRFFCFNYPKLVQDIDFQLKEALLKRNFKQEDLEVLKRIGIQLRSEIDQNRCNLAREQRIQAENSKYLKRLMIEIGEIDKIVQVNEKTGNAYGIYAQGSIVVRVTYNGKQRRTKKNLNLKNPKIYQLVRFPLMEEISESDILRNVDQSKNSLMIEVIQVDSFGDWNLLACQSMNSEDFENQLVHQKQLSLKLLKHPIKVQACINQQQPSSMFRFSQDLQGGQSRDTSQLANLSQSIIVTQQQYYNTNSTQLQEVEEEKQSQFKAQKSNFGPPKVSKIDLTKLNRRAQTPHPKINLDVQKLQEEQNIFGITTQSSIKTPTQNANQNILTPQSRQQLNQSSDQQITPRFEQISSNSQQSIKNMLFSPKSIIQIENQSDIDQDESVAFESSNVSIINLLEIENKKELQSNCEITLNLRIQMLTDSFEYLNSFLDQYQEMLEKVLYYQQIAEFQIQNQSQELSFNSDTPQISFYKFASENQASS